MLIKLKKKIRSLTHLIWLCLLITITVSVTYFYESNKKSQYDYLRKTLNNVFLLKTFAKITSELENRFIELDYTVKAGDTYESIIKGINISNSEKKLFLQSIKNNEIVRILRPNQKIYFKIDKKEEHKILEFYIELSKKKMFTLLKILKAIVLNQAS